LSKLSCMPNVHDDLHIEKKDLDEVFQYIEGYWPKLIRYHPKDLKTLIGLPNSYIVPTDSEIFQEQYYWDSYLIVRALINNPKYSHIAIGMVENLFYMIERFGIIPNASRFYFLSRSQPPLLSSMVLLIYGKIKDMNWLKKAVGYVEFEYNNVWMGETHLANFRAVESGLCRYYDVNAIDDLAEAESGWDLTSRFNGKCLDYLPVDLNCLLFLYEVDLAHIYNLLKNSKKVEKFEKAAIWRAKLINKLMWDEKTGYYFDYNFVKKSKSPLITVAGIYPLNVGIVSVARAQKAISLVEKILQKNYGVVQSVRFIENKQWDWPNGWSPLQLRAVEGLMRYGANRLARRLILKWLSLNIKIFRETGFLWEKYDVVHGAIGVPDRYPTLYGFAWTNACFLIMANMLEFLEKWPSENATPVWLVRRLGWY